MLFLGLAYFSPCVPKAISEKWVENGGSLTHTSADFHKAQFFFCNDMQDKWLNALLSRPVIVRHASWIDACVTENFRMPIAPYTLDDQFDESQLCSISPLEHVYQAATDESNFAQGVASVDGLALRSHVKDGLPRTNPYTRKRAPDPENESEVHAPQRPRKKARIDSQDVNRRKQEPVQHEKVQHQKGIVGEIQAVDNDSELRHITFNKPFNRKGKPSKGARKFERSVLRRQAFVPIAADPKKFHDDQLNQYSLFWNDIFAQSYPRDGSTTLHLSVEDVLLAPSAGAVIFDVNETYRGRRFINLQTLES